MSDKYLSGIFWNHLVYPEFATGEVENADAIKHWLSEQIKDEEWPEYAVALAIDNLFEKNEKERSVIINRVRDKIAVLLKPHECRLLGFAHRNSIYFCGSNITDKDLGYYFEKFRRVLTVETGADITIGIAKLPTMTLAGLQWAAQRAVVSQRQKMKSGCNRVYLHNNEDLPVPNLANYWRLALNLQDKLRAGHTQESLVITEEICSEIFRGTYMSLGKIRPVLQSLVILTAQATTDVGVDADSITIISEKMLTYIATEYDYMTLEYIIKSAITEFSTAINSHFNSGLLRMAAEIDEIIDNNLDNSDLSLHFISEKLSISAPYISRKYKEIRGICLTKVINIKRVQSAKKLLHQNKSVIETAFAVGYGTPQHFSRVFKEIVGVSPVRYRSTKNVQF
jgi:AraC-like DNA-binding protein